jgi:hypothetical protein
MIVDKIYRVSQKYDLSLEVRHLGMWQSAGKN